MSLSRSYHFLAPLYDHFVESWSRTMRRRSLEGIPKIPRGRILLVGIGTGLDLEQLETAATAFGGDLTPAMLVRARDRSRRLGRRTLLFLGDAHSLPFSERSFDAVILHLIVAVVPFPAKCLSEAERVTKEGGTIHILDKFLRPGEKAPLRRAVNQLLGRFVTRTDVVFEDVLAESSSLRLIENEPAARGGWFRRIVLSKPHDEAEKEAS